MIPNLWHLSELRAYSLIDWVAVSGKWILDQPFLASKKIPYLNFPIWIFSLPFEEQDICVVGDPANEAVPEPYRAQLLTLVGVLHAQPDTGRDEDPKIFPRIRIRLSRKIGSGSCSGSGSDLNSK